MPIQSVHACDLLGITLSGSRTIDNVLEKAVINFNMKSNEVILDFNYYHVILYRKLFVLILMDVIYGILNQEKCIIFMSLG